MAHDEHVTVTMTEVDGTKTELRVLPDRTIGFVRRRAQLTGAPRLNLCCEGALLADETLVRSLPAHRELTAWYPRYSRAQGGVSAQKSAARRRNSPPRTEFELAQRHTDGPSNFPARALAKRRRRPR